MLRALQVRWPPRSTCPRRTCSRSRRRAPRSRTTRGTCASTAWRSSARSAPRRPSEVELLRPLPRAQAARCTSWRCARAGTACTPALRHHQAVLRPLHAGDLGARLRAAQRPARARARLRRGASLRRLPDPPELPAAARPPWPPWYAPVALIGSLVAISLAIVPLLPLLLLAGHLGHARRDRAAGAGAAPGRGVRGRRSAVRRPSSARRGRGTSACGPRRFWPTVGWTVLAFALMLGFELGLIELFDVERDRGRGAGRAQRPGRHRRGDRGGAAGAGGRGDLLPRVLLPRAAHEAARLVGRARSPAACSPRCTCSTTPSPRCCW